MRLKADCLAFTLLREQQRASFRLRIQFTARTIQRNHHESGKTHSRCSHQSGQTKDADRFEFTYDMKQLYRVIHSIPEEMKVPFQMFVAGFKYREIAEKLGLPMGTVKSRLFFIRKRLKEELKDFSS